MKQIFFKYAFLLALIASVFSSCTSNDREDLPIEIMPTGSFANGMFILNEGGFGYSNASISFLANNGQVFNSIYSNVNSMNLGDVAQSMNFNGDKAYIVVNNSSAIEVVNRNTFKHLATVSNLIVNPRYIEFSGDTGFISNWGDLNDTTDDYVAVLNLETNLIEAKIPVAEGPERLLMDNGKIYVAHKGGLGYGNTISVIDVATQATIGSIEVGDVPDGMVINNGKLYVICSGKPSFTGDETLGSLLKINLSDFSIENEIIFPEGKHPSFLEFENNALYFAMEREIYKINTADFQLPQNHLFNSATSGVQILYGFKVNDGKIYIADARDYSSNGEVFIYSLNGELQQQFRVQIIPNSFYFNNQ